MAPRGPSGEKFISGKYRVLGTLGQGGMGSVFEAVNDLIGRKVALKVISPQLAADPEFRTRFDREARAAALINHPGIVDVLDMGETDQGAPFIVMEYLKGINLRRLHRELGTLSAGEASAVICPVLEALAAAHAKGVVHRDLKPANIFISVEPQRAVKVLDFGISKFSSAGQRVTTAGTTLGTPAFMAPEQMIDGSSVGPQSDLYSVGAVLYLLLSGKAPFLGSTNQELAGQVLHEVPPWLGDVRPDLPPLLVQLVMQLLDKQPEQRPPNARVALEHLKTAAPPAPQGVFAVAERLTGTPTEARTVIDAPSLTPTPTTHSRPPQQQTVPSETAIEGVALTAAAPAPVERPAENRQWFVWAFLGIALASLGFTWLALAWKSMTDDEPAVSAPAPVAKPAVPTK
jgi:eukaryotic-like serine/threonine-protein kinase